MEIHGFQKITVLDYPEHVACTVFTAGCNFRCPFCHNALLVTDLKAEDKLNESDIFSYLEKRKGVLDGVAVTGGEPLLQKDIADFLGKIKRMGYAVKLDTNGSFPDKLRELVTEGLCDYVAMDIKNSKAKYAETIGLSSFDISAVEKSVSFLLEGHVPYEFRTTVVSEYHTVKDIEEATRWIAGAQHYYLQNFVASDHLIAPGLSPVPKQTMQKMQEAAAVFVPQTKLRGID